jgi:hypothetical protein
MDDNSSVGEENHAVCDLLASKWSVLHNAAEQRGFNRQAAIEDGDVFEMDWETEEEMRAFKARERLEDELEAAQLAFIEDKLASVGARMMRPYEHWNEDEAYMQYQERDRD